VVLAPVWAIVDDFVADDVEPVGEQLGESSRMRRPLVIVHEELEDK